MLNLGALLYCGELKGSRCIHREGKLGMRVSMEHKSKEMDKQTKQTRPDLFQKLNLQQAHLDALGTPRGVSLWTFVFKSSCPESQYKNR